MKMPRSLRMRRRAEFLKVRRRGRSYAGRYLVLAWLRDCDLEGNRFGFITSKRVGNAVLRNLMRRRMRSIVRELGEEIPSGFLVVTIARKGAAEAPFAMLKDEWWSLAKRGGLLHQA